VATSLTRNPPTAAAELDLLADLLVRRQLLPLADARTWQQRAKDQGVSVDQALVAGGAFTKAQLLAALENHYFCPAVDAGSVKPDPAALQAVPRDFAERRCVLPLRLVDNQIEVALADPDDARTKEGISHWSRRQPRVHVALRGDLEPAIRAAYARHAEEARAADPKASAAARPTSERAAPAARTDQCSRPASRALAQAAQAADPAALVDAIIADAVARRATDVHLEAREGELLVRYRLDGILHAVTTLPRALAAPVTSRIKVLSAMDISERRIPQDGRYTAKPAEAIVDVRVSTLPAQFGEKVVMRLLRKDSKILTLDGVAMPAAVRQAYEEVVRNPLGFYLVTGPTGSGKTTTLHATLASLDRESINVVTLEDPIEYSLPGITQVQVHEAAGLTFASGLHAILRQDPNVILVGEIRDVDTVEIACAAALTGHKVLSTLHTNDACQAITRLLEMGTPPYLITATLRGVLAQRLVRTSCTACRETYRPNETELALLGYPKVDELARGAGCDTCFGTGYLGRTAVFEYFRLEESMHRLVLDRASPLALRHAAQRSGMVSMVEFARRMVLEGRTTVAEIQRVILAAETKERLCGSCQRVVSIEFSICPFCQHVLKEQCGKCRTPVDPGWEACPSCGESIAHEWQRVYCRHCVAPIEPGLSSCPYCGGES
jgi:type IV pilus assembly protein PilB